MQKQLSTLALAGLLAGVFLNAGVSAAAIRVGLLDSTPVLRVSERLSGLGFATTQWVSGAEITASSLATVDVLYVATANAHQLSSKQLLIAEWVSLGNGLIVEQPNRAGIVSMMPPGLEISIWSSNYDGSHSDPDPVRAIVPTSAGLTHPVIGGLGSEALGSNADRVLLADVSSNFEILAVQETNTNYVAVAAAHYRRGRVVFHTNNISPFAFTPGSDEYLQQMVSWAAVPEPSSIASVPAITLALAFSRRLRRVGMSVASNVSK